MPIVCYTGLPRSGKTYQVVAHVICAAMRQGRRIITNIAGVQEQSIREYLIEEGCDPDKIGEIVCVTHDEVSDEKFFRTDTDHGLGIETFVQPGDLVCLDEVWRFWPKRGKISERSMNFFRMHGHLVDDKTGLICEVALISQCIKDINEHIRDVVAETYRMTKDTAVGSDKSYLVQVFSRGSEMARDEIRRFKGMYNPKFFAFYKSHSQAKEGSLPKEDSVDKRGNVLKGPLFKIVLPAMAFALIFAGYQLWKFFHPQAVKPVVQAEGAPVAPGQSAPSAKPAKPDDSNQWRLLGWYKRGLETAALVESSGGIRLIRGVDKWVLYGYGVEGEIDGEKVSIYTGATRGMMPAAVENFTK